MALKLQILGKQKLFDVTTRFRDAVVKSVDCPYAGRAPMERVEADPMTKAEDEDSHTDPYVVSSHIFVRYVDCETHNRMLITALALDEYFEQHRSYPESLTSLIPQYLAHIPDDPFAFSESLHYRRTGSRYLLYSAGPDGIDNHGTPINSAAVGLNPVWVKSESNGDVVYGVNP